MDEAVKYSSSSRNINWASLPEEILELILDNLVSVFDYATCSVVCKDWSLAAKYKSPYFLSESTSSKQLPLLIIPSTNNDKFSLYKVTNSTTCDFQLPPRIHRKQSFIGSSHGWLATLNRKNRIITLANPFTNEAIVLPQMPWPSEDWNYCSAKNMMEEDYQYLVRKIVLSNKPYPSSSLSSSCDSEVVGISGVYRHLIRLRPGTKQWSILGTDYKFFHDIIYYKDMILATDLYGRLISVDARSNQLNTIIPQRREIGVSLLAAYLVKSTRGELLTIRRFGGTLKEEYNKTNRFEVYKFHKEGDRAYWIKVTSLGDDAVFVGENHTVCISSSDFPGCKSNSIYYTDEFASYASGCKVGPSDLGVYNLEDRSVSKHYPNDSPMDKLAPAIWILPTIQFRL